MHAERVGKLVGQHDSLEASLGDRRRHIGGIGDSRLEALAETGNVILNSCLATIANSLESRLKISLPEVLRGESTRFFNLPPPPTAGPTVLFVYINFTVRRRDIEGYIAMLMDLPSLAALRNLLDALIRRTGGTSQA